MARSEFGGTDDDFVTASYTFAGKKLIVAQPNVVVKFWSAKTGGTQYTDLQDATGAAISSVTSDSAGFLPTFFGPDGVAAMWADAGGGRVKMVTIDRAPFAGLGDADIAALVPNSATSTGAALSRAYGRRRPTLPGEPVGAYGGGAFAENTQATTGGVTWVSLHRVAVAISELRLVWVNGHYSPSNVTGEVTSTNAYPVKASVQVGTKLTRVTFNGARQGTVDPGGTLVSDPLALDLDAGTQFSVRTFNNIANGAKWPQQIGQNGSGVTYTAGGSVGGAGGAGYTMGSDLTDVTTNYTSSSSASFGGPGLIIGTVKGTPGKSVFAVGDSIDAGAGDDSVNYNQGWLARSINATLPLYRATYPSTRIQGFRAGHAYGFGIASNFTHLISGYGSNDIFVDLRTYAQVQADLTWFYTAARARGLKVIARTILPSTTSTDAWATTGNQTAKSGTTVRNQINTWIRGGAGGLLDGYIETADAVETARDSGIWKASYTTDGVHPNTTAATAMAATFNPSTMLP